MYFRKWNVLALILKNLRKWKPRKKIPYISGKGNPKKSSYISWNGTFQPKLEKQKNPPRENFLYSNIKKILIISQKKAFLIFWETETPKKIFIFWEVTFRAQKIKRTHSEKNVLFFEKWNFLALGLKNLWCFRMKLAVPGKQTNNLFWRNFLSLVTFL